jgi:hypothetical protein
VPRHNVNVGRCRSVIELQVFLLKHLNLQTSSPTASVATTPLASRRSSDASLAARGESVGCVILDDLKGFASVQNAATIDQATKSAMRTAGRIQWCSRDSEAVVIVSDQSGTILEDTTSTELLEVKMKKKQVESLLDPAAGVPSLREVESMQQRRDMEKIRDWLKSHSGVTPLAKILSNRTRFFGPVAGGQAWAFVDRDIKMISHSDYPGWVTSESEGGPEGAKMFEFPHAVVEIQWDGKQTPAFIHELMQSHFVCPICEDYINSECSRFVPTGRECPGVFNRCTRNRSSLRAERYAATCLGKKTLPSNLSQKADRSRS